MSQAMGSGEHASNCVLAAALVVLKQDVAPCLLRLAEVASKPPAVTADTGTALSSMSLTADAAVDAVGAAAAAAARLIGLAHASSSLPSTHVDNAVPTGGKAVGGVPGFTLDLGGANFPSAPPSLQDRQISSTSIFSFDFGASPSAVGHPLLLPSSSSFGGSTAFMASLAANYGSLQSAAQTQHVSDAVAVTSAPSGWLAALTGSSSGEALSGLLRHYPELNRLPRYFITCNEVLIRNNLIIFVKFSNIRPLSPPSPLHRPLRLWFGQF